MFEETNFIQRYHLQYPYLFKRGILSLPAECVFGEDYVTICDQIHQNALTKLNDSPNTMHKYGASDNLSPAQFEALIQQIGPVLYDYYDIPATKQFVLHRDFTVHYSGKLDRKLGIHVDDSDITLNICIENTLSRTGLRFDGTGNSRFSKINPMKQILVDLAKYDVIIHRGNHPHEVSDLQQEDIQDPTASRVCLIVWLKAVQQ